HLEAGGTEGAIHQLAATEGGSFGDTGQFRLLGSYFFLQSGTVGIAVGAVGGLDSQVADTLQDIGGLLQGTFSGLRQGDTIVGVTGRHVLAVDLVGQAVRDPQTGGGVLGTVDAATGGQALHGGVQGVGRVVDIALGIQRRDVGIDGKSHDEPPRALVT